jgi:hypothetical protein
VWEAAGDALGPRLGSGAHCTGEVASTSWRRTQAFSEAVGASFSGPPLQAGQAVPEELHQDARKGRHRGYAENQAEEHFSGGHTPACCPDGVKPW